MHRSAQGPEIYQFGFDSSGGGCEVSGLGSLEGLGSKPRTSVIAITAITRFLTTSAKVVIDCPICDPLVSSLLAKSP